MNLSDPDISVKIATQNNNKNVQIEHSPNHSNSHSVSIASSTFCFLRLPKSIIHQKTNKESIVSQGSDVVNIFNETLQINKQSQLNKQVKKQPISEVNVSSTQLNKNPQIFEQSKDVPVVTVVQKKKLATRKIFTQSDLDKISKDFRKMMELQQTPSLEKGKKLTLSQIARNHGFSYSSISRLIAQYLEDEKLTERRSLMNKVREKSLDGITKQRLAILNDILRENPCFVQREIANKMNEYENLRRTKANGKSSIHSPCISRLLRLGGYRKKMIQKVPMQRNTQANIQKRYDYSVRYLELLKQNRKIYFLDESGFSVSSTRLKAWSRVNEEVRVKSNFSKNQVVSLLAIIGIDGLAYWDAKVGNYDRITYLRLMNQIFTNVNDLNGSNEKSVLIMDNCTIHDKAQTNKFAEQKNIQILFLPPYSPQLNPIQNWFHEIKSKLRQKIYKNSSELLIQMKIILERYNDYDFKKYYGSIHDSLQKGLRKEPL